MQAPTECYDVSFLLETNHLEETEDINAKERFVRQQKEQLEKECQKLLDFATELAKQVSVVLIIVLRTEREFNICIHQPIRAVQYIYFSCISSAFTHPILMIHLWTQQHICMLVKIHIKRPKH